MLQSSGDGERVRPAHRTWLIMPFMHSERLADQQVMAIGVERLLCLRVHARRGAISLTFIIHWLSQCGPVHVPIGQN